MKNNLVGLTVGIVCAFILIGTILVPFIDDVSAETKTYYNDGTPFALTDSEDTDTHTLVLGSDDDGNIEITLDGEICETPDMTGYSSATVVFAKSTFVRLDANGVVYMYGNNGSATYGGINLGNCLSADITFEIVGTTMTVSTYTVSNVYAYISTEGDYRLSTNPYVLEDSVVYAGALTILSSTTIGVILRGSLDDLTVYACYPSGRSVGTPEVNLTNYVTDLYVLDSITVECFSNSTSIGTMTVNYLLAPYEIVYENPDYIGETESVLIGIIPLFLILAVLCAVTYAVMRDRD